MRAFGHIATVGALLATFLIAPILTQVDVAALMSPADAMSSATAIVAAPDGHYTILINGKLHTDEQVLADWVTFFEGERDAPLIMEDVSCLVLSGDAAGIEMAESLQSRLAENQMSIRSEVPPLALSKAEAGLFDVLVMSDAAAEAYGAQTVEGLDFVEAVHR